MVELLRGASSESLGKLLDSLLENLDLILAKENKLLDDFFWSYIRSLIYIYKEDSDKYLPGIRRLLNCLLTHNLTAVSTSGLLFAD
jgi:hypothetical protein|mmetsp:Transcript_12428/g.1861  ORF Transcript_12428/g.1861 Transcript_12428/m.1861 type:complete len:86 (+) Transcript_12428:1859-2116(+)